LQKDNITKENLDQQIREATNLLLEMAREHSWNNISNNLKFIVKIITRNENSFEPSRLRKKRLGKEKKLDLESAITQLKSNYDNTYLIELYIFKANKKETIVDIQILEKSELEPEFRRTIYDNPPQLHCKVALPPYIGREKKYKFDINWELGTIEYKWKMFWWRKRMEKILNK